MTRKSLIAYCLAKPGASSDFPFDETTMTIRVGGKIFALVGAEAKDGWVNLKCDPEAAGELREAWPAITPGYHMNKEHWNTVRLDGSLPAKLERVLVDRSYELVVSGLSRKDREKAGL